MLQIKVFDQSGLRSEHELGYQEVIANKERGRAIFGPSCEHADIKHELPYVVYGSYASRQMLICKPLSMVINFHPVRAIVLPDRIVMFVTSAGSEDAIVDNMTRLIKELSVNENVAAEFQLIGVESVLLTALALLKADFMASKKAVAHSKDLPTLSRLKHLQFNELDAQRIAGAIKTYVSTLSTFIDDENHFTHLAPNTDREDVEEQLLYVLHLYTSLASAVNEYNEDLRSEQSITSLTFSLEETRLFRYSLIMAIFLAMSTLGVFLTGLATMNVSVPDALAAGGSFPNSYPTNGTVLDSLFLPYTGIILILMLVWGVFHWYRSVRLFDSGYHAGVQIL